MDDDSLRKNRGYWVYMNESGNLSLGSAGGTLSDETYDWDKLRFVNSSGSELNVSDAGSAGWIQHENINYYGIDPFGDPNFLVISSGDSFSPWKGYFVYSYFDNMTLIRQN